METIHADADSHSLCQPSECCNACSAHEQIRQQISELENQLAKLKVEERKVLSQMNTSHNHLQKIPIEVVSRIFEEILEDEDTIMLPFGLGRVCRYWREVAWNTPILWNKPTVIVNRFGDRKDMVVFNKHLEMLQDWVSRSGSLPLFIFILYNKHRQDVPLLLYDIAKLVEYLQEPDISNRTVHLRLDVPLRWLVYFNGIRITSLKTTANTMFDWYELDSDFQPTALAANLETLTVASGKLAERLAGTPCPKLVNLEILDSPIEVADLIQLMHCTPILQRCCCEVVADDSVPPGMGTTMQSPTVLQHLQHLEINPMWICDTSSLFDNLTLPALQYLDIQKGDVDASSMISLFKRSQCHLKTFKFTGNTNWTILDLESLLASLPKHPFLSFGPIFKSATVSEILQTVLASSTTSRMERDVVSTFDCIIPWKTSDKWDFIPELFGRTSHTHEKRPMDIKLSLIYDGNFEGTAALWIPVEALEVIRALEEQGWRWSMDVDSGLGIRISNLVDASTKYHQDLATA